MVHRAERLDEFLSPDLLRADRAALPRRAARASRRASTSTATTATTWWVHVIPMFDDDGNVSGGMAKWRDITARKAAERELAAHARDLERSNAELEQFAYVASHDLTEPLRMITRLPAAAASAATATSSTTDAQQFIDFAVDGALRMRGLIDDLLDLLAASAATSEPTSWSTLQALVEDDVAHADRRARGPRGDAARHRPAAGRGRPAAARPALPEPARQRDSSSCGPARAPVVEVRAEPLPGRRLDVHRLRRGHRLRRRRRRSGSSASSSGCTRATSTRAPGSGSPSRARSSRATAGASGPSRARAAARASSSTSRAS